MRYILILIIFNFYQNTLFAQQNVPPFDGETLPVFGNGHSDMLKYLSDSIRYPSYAEAEFIEGKVVLKIRIAESGAISNITVIKPVHSSLDSEAVRVVGSMPPWTPAMIGSKAVPFDLTLPIQFSLGLPKPVLQMEWNENKNAMESEFPKFPGGESELKRFIYKNLKYPAVARNNGIQGIVKVNFYILEDGKIEYIDADNLGWGLTEEAVRIVKLMPNWTPGIQDKIPSKVKAQLSITFSIQ